MTSSKTASAPQRRLIIPPLRCVYANFHDIAETVLRVVAGLALVTHGWGKIQNPFGAAGMVEGLGFYPGVFWSPLLAATEFFGGILIAIGLLTRPASFAAMIVLLVTVYFHWIVRAEGFAGAEKSILWAAIFLFFAVRGGNRQSVDAKLGREF
ncbi:DoxX family protein [Arvimicrobium flavum]|uniref:DoxX family protein n=1 Tax=Arvimicrobium flavum TaxID=3393320 RepID=UPI00237A2669|nr:DoxX family protein [Mesorhizobium shangrilense]